MTEHKHTYRINEIFYSLQGEGVRAGTANIFIRFSGCNLACDTEAGPKSPGGFKCDTEFASGRSVTLQEMYEWIWQAQYITLNCKPGEKSVGCEWIILTGGEPALQVDKELCDFLHERGYKLAIETNGSIEMPVRGEEKGGGIILPTEHELKRYRVDWITVSPKVAEHAIAQRYAHEVKYVRGYGQAIPKTVVEAEHYLISPAFDGNQIHPKTLEWCNKLVLENPKWRLSIQAHKLLQVR